MMTVAPHKILLTQSARAIARSGAGKPGFTLVEMLTVVGIIILVLAISLPSIRSMVGDTQFNSAVTLSRFSPSDSRTLRSNSPIVVSCPVERAGRVVTLQCAVLLHCATNRA